MKTTGTRKKSSSEERLIVANGVSRLELPGASVQSIATADVIETIQYHAVRGFDDEPLAETVRWCIESGPMRLYLLELAPELRNVRWIAPESAALLGEAAEYRNYRLATPFVVLKVPFLNGRLHPTCELFYRDSSVTVDGAESDLYWSNLLNVSPDSYGVKAWVCTQFLKLERGRDERRRRPGYAAQLDALVSHIWGGGFNRSSELHEGKSCFSKAMEDGIDSRVTDVERWQEASIENPRFVLDVDWKPTGLTIRKLVEHQLELFRLPLDLARTPELTNALQARRAPRDEEGGLLP